MDARVNDFLSEIDEIAPLNESKDKIVWEKCLDDDSGYYYYWNTITNEVTWDMPVGYKVQKSKPKKSLFIPPRLAPLFPSTCSLPEVSEPVKIYKIAQSTDTVAESSSTKDNHITNFLKTEKKKVVSKPYPKNNDSDDEKIVLISSYGGDSETEDEDPQQKNGADKNLTMENNGNVIVMQKNIKEAGPVEDCTQEIKVKLLPSAGISLLAEYGDSEDESDLESSNSKNVIIPPPPQEKQVSHSTLFPIVKPISVKDFEVSSQTLEATEDFDAKSFKRKRRIGVALLNTGKKVKPDEDIERKGLGFDNDSGTTNYPSFKSGGVMFVKADVLNPSPVNSKEIVNNSQIIPGEIDETYSTLKEKLGFLSEGREPVSPVQAMLIQVETLYAAVKTGDLKHNYLSNWLKETNTDLIKLENEAAPIGWLLEWDRSHKRYYYENKASGESQWEYPQTDVTACDEEMDICTTPPPNDIEPPIHMSPPMPPVICSPSPPPPPKISGYKPSKRKNCDIPLPSEPDDEPLPPGVDVLDITSNKSKAVPNMNEALSSFYSDIAAIETSNSPPAQQINDDVKVEAPSDNQPQLKKKKKSKVKLTQGIAMKKKGVSKLVEKWKNVHLTYD